MTRNPYIDARSGAVDPQQRNREWWERLPMTYEEWSGDDRTTTRDRVVDQFLAGNPWLDPAYFGSFAGRRVLDLGSGAGPATCLFAQGGADVTAVDLTEAAVALTRAHAEPLGASVIRADAEALPFPDASFDHVFSWGVLHHSAHPERAFAEIRRVLRPGGTALVMTYNRLSLRYYVKGLWWLLAHRRLLAGDDLASVQRFFTDGYFHRHYSPRELRDELRRAGLEATRTSVTHMGKQMVPRIPAALDELLKSRAGWLLVIECVRA